MYKINIIDAICGSGKSTAMINYINNASSDEKFLYITPFLTEIERIKVACKSKKFCSPKNIGTKIEGFKQLLLAGENIVSTHALFEKFNEEIINIAYLNNYTLILDEVVDVVRVIPLNKYDKNHLMQHVSVDENNILTWETDDYNSDSIGKFKEEKKMCELGSVMKYGDNNRSVLLWMFPISIFNAFKKVFVLTYLFDAQIQKYYYDLHNVEYNYMYIKDYQLTDEPQPNMKDKYRNLINICEHDKMNKIGDLSGSLSWSWYDNNEPKSKRNGYCFNTLRKNCENYFRHIVKTPSQYNFWTTFKPYVKYVSGNGYARGFEHINMRASNDYIEKESIAYLANRYLNPVIKNFFKSNGVEIDEDLYATSELIQFIFRTRIRVGKPINIYLPSERMRELLYDWLDN